MRRILLVVGLLGGMLFLTPGAALACSCAQETLAQHIAQAGTVVDADLVWHSSTGVDSTYGIAVRSVFKGKAAQDEKLISAVDEAACGLGELTTKKRYLFFVKGEHPGKLSVNLCGGTTAYTAALAQQVQKVTGEASGPYVNPPESSGAVDEDPIAGTSVWTILGTGAVIALVLGGLMYLRKRA